MSLKTGECLTLWSNIARKQNNHKTIITKLCSHSIYVFLHKIIWNLFTNHPPLCSWKLINIWLLYSLQLSKVSPPRIHISYVQSPSVYYGWIKWCILKSKDFTIKLLTKKYNILNTSSLRKCEQTWNNIHVIPP